VHTGSSDITLVRIHHPRKLLLSGLVAPLIRPVAILLELEQSARDELLQPLSHRSLPRFRWENIS
jgi:hypothetical protein